MLLRFVCADLEIQHCSYKLSVLLSMNKLRAPADVCFVMSQ